MYSPPSTYEVVIRWTPEDVKYLCPYLTDDEAEKILVTIGDDLEDRSIERGWESLESLIGFLGYRVDPHYGEPS